MSQYPVKASFCSAGLAPRLQSDICREFSDAVSGQAAATVDLSGTKLYMSLKCHKLEFVDCLDTCCSALLSESFLNLKLSPPFTIY